ncbi:MAG TPA: helix-hairpin-helix domain-containing protein [Terriglobales bacterium]|nr:helix-hairpin-helix domain-containing protein [Terriglobales bacterium]
MRKRWILPAVFASALTLGLAACNACYSSQSSSPEQIRQKTAETTAQLKDDAKAVTEGVRDGLTRPSSDKPLDLNHASKSQLMSLPGMDDATADRIIAGRPYSSEHELLEHHIVSRDEYNKIADSITVKR